MCGITGWIDWERDLTQCTAIVEAMTATLSLRGPDARGVWAVPRAALGHRRLTVVDPEGGAQPMTFQIGDRTYAMVYNGELYNTEDIRQSLLARGHTFHGHSDTEVLLHAYVEWGPACVDQLNGIFAFGIWDGGEERLFMARDRLGVKPLFYAPRHRSLLFGSELKALLAHPDVEPQLDEEGLSELLFLGPSRTPGHGIYRNVRELKPGHAMLYDRAGIRTYPYWQLISRPHDDTLEMTTEKVRALVVDAIERQLVSDVPIATLLSGGLDSSIITAVAATAFQRSGRAPLHTWSIDYRDNHKHFQASSFQPDADAPFIERMTQTLGTIHHDIIIDTPELIESLTAATLARDLPGMADVDSSLYLFCRAIKNDVTVVLSGECADEIFGGYPWFRSADALHTDGFPWIRMTAERAALLKPEVRAQLHPEAYIADRYHQSIADVPKLHGEDPLEARRRNMFYLNMAWFMATLLERKDRMSMYASLEARVPFCDHRIVEYVWNIPWAMKMVDDREKGILRRAMRGLLPDDVLYRKKSPYPKTHNPAYYHAVRDWAIRLLDDASSPLHLLFDVAKIRELTQRDPAASGMPWFGQLMGLPQLFAWLVQVDTWMRHYNVRLR